MAKSDGRTKAKAAPKAKPGKSAPKDNTVPAEDPKKTMWLKESDWPRLSRERINAEMSQAGLVSSAQTIMSFVRPMLGDLDITESVAALKDRAGQMVAGDLSRDGGHASRRRLHSTGCSPIWCAGRCPIWASTLARQRPKSGWRSKAQGQCRAAVEALAEECES